MKRSTFHFGLLILPALLASCTIWRPTTLFNNTGQAIELSMRGDTYTIIPNQFVQFRHPSGHTNWEFRLTGGGCEYLYDIPDFHDDYSFPIVSFGSERGGQMQVEKDFNLNFLSPSYAADTPASGEMILKQKGFPLQPVSRKCH